MLWEIPFEPGVLLAKANGAEDTLATPDIPEAIDLIPYTADDSGDRSVVQILVSLRDRHGNICAGEDRTIRYQLLGDGDLLGIENGKPDDLTPYSTDSRKTFQGQSIVYVRINQPLNPIKLYAFTKDNLHAEIDISC